MEAHTLMYLHDSVFRPPMHNMSSISVLSSEDGRNIAKEHHVNRMEEKISQKAARMTSHDPLFSE